MANDEASDLAGSGRPGNNTPCKIIPATLGEAIQYYSTVKYTAAGTVSMCDAAADGDTILGVLVPGLDDDEDGSGASGAVGEVLIGDPGVRCKVRIADPAATKYAGHKLVVGTTEGNLDVSTASGARGVGKLTDDVASGDRYAWMEWL